MYSYSSRLPWSFSPNQISQLLEQKRAHGVQLLDLTISNPTVALDAYPHEAIARAYCEISEFRYQPDPAGHRAAREAVAAQYAASGVVVSPEQVLLTASTSEAYAVLFKLFCDAGGEILTPVPSYPLFEHLAALESVRTVPYRLFYDGVWSIDFDHLRQQITKRTRAIVVVNPNNPTGSYLKQDEAAALLEIANDHRLPIISDEVFTDFPLDMPSSSMRTFTALDSPLTFSLNGLSKSAGMPQMKLGWMVVNGPAADCAAARTKLELILDTYLSVSTPVQNALPALLSVGAEIRRELRVRTRRNLASAHTLLAGSAGHPLHVEGGWSVILQLPRVRSEDAWVKGLIEECGVVTQPGYFFDMSSEAYVVASLITDPEQFDVALRLIRDHVSKYA